MGGRPWLPLLACPLCSRFGRGCSHLFAGILRASSAAARRRSGACPELPPLARPLRPQRGGLRGISGFEREDLQALLSGYAFTSFAQTSRGKKKQQNNTKTKKTTTLRGGKIPLILGAMSEPRSCQPEGKAFCQVMEKGPETADACVAFFFFFSPD